MPTRCFIDDVAPAVVARAAGSGGLGDLGTARARHPTARAASPRLARQLIEEAGAVVVDVTPATLGGAATRAGGVLDGWRARGQTVVVVSHDARVGHLDMLRWLEAVGYETTPDLLLPVGRTTARTVARRHPGARVLTLGPVALEAELDRAGLERTAGATGADVVVVGGPPRAGSDALVDAVRAVEAGAELYATSRDGLVRTPHGILPGAGSMAAAVETATGRCATVIGRPSTDVLDAAVALAGTTDVTVVTDDASDGLTAAMTAGFAAVLVGSPSSLPEGVVGIGSLEALRQRSGG